jgi:polyisoprenoid-binding protein YceI
MTMRWNIDGSHSAAEFAVRHLMITNVKGRFGTVSGTVDYDPEKPEASQIDVSIDATSIDTRDEKRDAHLRSADFFDVEQHPTMTFASSGLRALDASWILEGELTIGSVTRAVRLDLEFLGFDPTGMQGEPRIGFEGRTSINRSDFGISFGLVDGAKIVVSDRVDISLEIEAVLAG